MRSNPTSVQADRTVLLPVHNCMTLQLSTGIALVDSVIKLRLCEREEIS